MIESKHLTAARPRGPPGLSLSSTVRSGVSVGGGGCQGSCQAEVDLFFFRLQGMMLWFMTPRLTTKPAVETPPLIMQAFQLSLLLYSSPPVLSSDASTIMNPHQIVKATENSDTHFYTIILYKKPSPCHNKAPAILFGFFTRQTRPPPPFPEGGV